MHLYTFIIFFLSIVILGIISAFIWYLISREKESDHEENFSRPINFKEAKKAAENQKPEKQKSKFPEPRNRAERRRIAQLESGKRRLPPPDFKAGVVEKYRQGKIVEINDFLKEQINGNKKKP